MVGLTRSTYYDIKFHQPGSREIRHLLLADLIADIHARSRGTYGMLRVRAALGGWCLIGVPSGPVAESGAIERRPALIRS